MRKVVKMADNIKYIRWAAKVLKVVMVINILIGFGTMYLTTIAAMIAGTRGGTITTGIVAGGFTILIDFVGIIVNAFILYTAARGLELLSDMAYTLLRTWQQSQ